MKGWAQKKAVLAATKSLAVQGWLRDYNENGAVPCEVQTGPLTASTQRNAELKAGHTWIGLLRPDGARYRLQVPTSAVFVEHRWFKHSIRLNMLPQAMEVMRGSSSAA